MQYALITDNTPSELTGASIFTGDVQFSHATMLQWSDQERADHGIYPIADDEIPDGKVATGSTLEYADGVVSRHWTLEDAPPPPVPESVTPAQARVALLNAGLLASVKSAVDQADEATHIWFEFALEWRRDNPVLAGLGVALGLSSDDIDNLFRAAAAIAA